MNMPFIKKDVKQAVPSRATNLIKDIVYVYKSVFSQVNGTNSEF